MIIKKQWLMIGASVVAGVLFFGVLQASADDQPALTNEHKDRIAANCTSARASLQRLHRSDASLRFDRGQLYEFIGSKLMARLNSRMALNQLDAGELVALAARYDRELAEFRTTFQQYEERLSSVVRIDCIKQPEVFYYSVRDVRERRTAVHRTAESLGTTIDDYYKVFEDFMREYRLTVRREGAA